MVGTITASFGGGRMRPARACSEVNITKTQESFFLKMQYKLKLSIET